jgi:hypothetical protein
MRGTLLTALAVAFVLSTGVSIHRAEAAPLGSPSALRTAAASATLVQQAANVCGSNGCVRVQTQRVIRRQKPGTIAANHI